MRVNTGQISVEVNMINFHSSRSGEQNEKQDTPEGYRKNELSGSDSGDHRGRQDNSEGYRNNNLSTPKCEESNERKGTPNKGNGASKTSGFRSGDHSKGQGNPGKRYGENKSLDSRNGDNSERLDTSCFKSGDHSEMQYTSEKCEMNELPCSKSEKHSERSYFSGSRVGDQDEYINECEECKPSVLIEGDHEGEYRTHTCLRSVVHNEKQDNHTVSRSGDEKESYNMPFPALSMETSIEEVKERSK